VGTGGLDTSQAAPATPRPSTVGPDGRPEARAVALVQLDETIALATRPGDGSLYIAGKRGTVHAVVDGRVDPEPALDLSDRVSTGSEQGLLGLAFSPDGSYAYVNYTDLAGDTNVVELAWVDGRADLASERLVLTVAQPFTNHNGGNLAFGPDGYLYIGLGDGGSGYDPNGNGQNLDTLLGKMLRIAPRGSDGSPPSGGRGYLIPPDNPFVDDPDARPEIWAWGLRNPWRYSFDRSTGDLWIGDVGQSSLEEIDVQPADDGGGQNYGWAILEGTERIAGDPPPDAVPPVFEYAQADEGGCAVTGGYVYRGEEIPDLRGWYVFADFCLGNVSALRLDPGGPRVVPIDQVPQVASFGQDRRGELYVLSLAGTVFRLTA
jgi:glucose/arabinose dehydrogenase